MPPSPVDRYARHAEFYGTELVFETAMTELSTLQLGSLSLRLQRHDPKWRPAIDSVIFAHQLIEVGVPRERACRMATISVRSLQRYDRLHESEQQAPDQGSKPLIARGEIATNWPTPTETPLPPDLSRCGAENGADVPGQLELFAGTLSSS